MRDDLRQRARAAVDMARRAGANDVIAAASRQRSVEFRQRNEILERVEESTSRGLQLRLYVDGRYSVHGTSDLDPERLSGFVGQAVAMTRALDVDPDRLITDPVHFDNRPTDDLDRVDGRLHARDPESRRQAVEEVVEAGRAHEQVISVTGTAGDMHSLSAMASSNGFEGTKESTVAWMSSSVTLRGEGDRRPDGHFSAQTCHLGDLPEPALVGRRGLERTVARLGASQGSTQRATMVVEPMVSGSLLRRLLGPASAEAWSQERSYFRGHLGERLFSERLTVTDDPLVPRGLGSRHYDGEGISARRHPIIEAGVARNVYADTYYGRKIDMTPTTGSSSNVVVELGDRHLDQLIADVGEGILVTSWLGGNSDPTTGEFSIGMRGHQIEGGRVGRPVSEMNVSGELRDLFSHLAAVGSDPWPYSSYRVPTLVFEDVQFSGA